MQAFIPATNRGHVRIYIYPNSREPQQILGDSVPSEKSDDEKARRSCYSDHLGGMHSIDSSVCDGFKPG